MHWESIVFRLFHLVVVFAVVLRKLQIVIANCSFLEQSLTALCFSWKILLKVIYRSSVWPFLLQYKQYLASFWFGTEGRNLTWGKRIKQSFSNCLRRVATFFNLLMFNLISHDVCYLKFFLNFTLLKNWLAHNKSNQRSDLFINGSNRVISSRREGIKKFNWFNKLYLQGVNGLKKVNWFNKSG